MLGYLREWYFWVIVVVIIIIIIWIYTKIYPTNTESTVAHSTAPKAADNAETTQSEETSHNENPMISNRRRIDAKRQKRNYRSEETNTNTADDYVVHRRNKRRNFKVYSSRTAIVSTESIPDIDDVNEEIDLTPDIQQDLWDLTSETLVKQSKGEAECKKVIEGIYRLPFQVQVRPKWLVNPKSGRCLELDLYNEQLKIAVEYNGQQHYKYTPRFQRSYQDFKDQVERDNVKIDLCDQHGVYLITVPYNVPHDKIDSYIRYWLPEAVRARSDRLNSI